MTHSYKFRLVCRCPNDKSVNIYDVEITTENQIQVEVFNKIQEKIYKKFMYQEELFDMLKEGLMNHDTLTLVGTHLGVEVISES
tara:strand:+ start:368 stop:619 length:252 start_codon:yes stop_codon:yes gene_type:complete